MAYDPAKHGNAAQIFQSFVAFGTFIAAVGFGIASWFISFELRNIQISAAADAERARELARVEGARARDTEAIGRFGSHTAILRADIRTGISCLIAMRHYNTKETSYYNSSIESKSVYFFNPDIFNREILSESPADRETSFVENERKKCIQINREEITSYTVLSLNSYETLLLSWSPDINADRKKLYYDQIGYNLCSEKSVFKFLFKGGPDKFIKQVRDAYPQLALFVSNCPANT
ncbi:MULTISPECIES: hypothetical protein [unclassified Bosea (in: a-proteobacteria)]|uniref:hypothetical protein n=1 Tax=unclassified Bosea (in: a-proteobacteria) TaxID=2653178 RepID=UPI000F7DF81D|nr:MULTISPECIES: hypothetical protein [unclassified Bosea (in: a-proteobacteria)]